MARVACSASHRGFPSRVETLCRVYLLVCACLRIRFDAFVPGRVLRRWSASFRACTYVYMCSTVILLCWLYGRLVEQVRLRLDQGWIRCTDLRLDSASLVECLALGL